MPVKSLTPYRPGALNWENALNVLATLAEFEGGLVRLCTSEDSAVARPKGKLRGKQPKLSEKQQKGLFRLREIGQYSISSLAELFAVSRPIVYRTLSRQKRMNNAYTRKRYYIGIA